MSPGLAWAASTDATCGAWVRWVQMFCRREGQPGHGGDGQHAARTRASIKVQVPIATRSSERDEDHRRVAVASRRSW